MPGADTRSIGPSAVMVSATSSAPTPASDATAGAGGSTGGATGARRERRDADDDRDGGEAPIAAPTPMSTARRGRPPAAGASWVAAI